MTLRELAERYDKEQEFRVTDEKGKNKGKFERNELVKLDYAIAKREVVTYCNNPVEYKTLIVQVKFD